MAANTTPIFPLTPKASWTGNLTTGTNTYDGTSGTTLLMTAGADGALVKTIEAEAAGTNTQSLLRIFLNNGSTNATASNNALIFQALLPGTTAATTAATSHMSIPLNFAIPASYKLYATLVTTVAAGWNITAMFGDY
jgi:hypothetical protein